MIPLPMVSTSEWMVLFGGHSPEPADLDFARLTLSSWRSFALNPTH